MAGAAFYLFCQRRHFVPTCRNHSAETQLTYKTQFCAGDLCCGASCLLLFASRRHTVVPARTPPEYQCTTPIQLTSKVLHFLPCFRQLSQITAALKRRGASLRIRYTLTHTVPDTGNCLTLCCRCPLSGSDIEQHNRCSSRWQYISVMYRALDYSHLLFLLCFYGS